jgi:hypothetical protein
MSHIEKESCYNLQLSVTLRCNIRHRRDRQLRILEVPQLLEQQSPANVLPSLQHKHACQTGPCVGTRNLVPDLVA